MPKLVIKQELPPLSPHEKLLRTLRVIVPVLLLAISLLAVLGWYFLRDTDAKVSDLLSAAPPSSYLKEQQKLESLSAEFEQLSHQGAESYGKNRQLADKAGAVLSQLGVLDDVVNSSAMPLGDKQILLSRQQFQKDDWDSKLHFHTLRMDRFKPAAAAPAPEPKPQPSQAQAAQPIRALPPGVVLPPGVCPLFGPGAGECKAEAKAKASQKP